jgi:hypothetical protein
MSRRVLRSWKCKTGHHQGTAPWTVPVVLDDSGERFENTYKPCRWHGCRCYCHPWFQKRPGLKIAVKQVIADGGWRKAAIRP